MAYTKIHAITATVSKAVDYICNPAKTDEGILISSYGCSPETAAYDFKFALSKTSQSDPNKTYHLIQSFLPGEVSYKEAHQIGVELADRLLEGKYSNVVSTHIDKGHVHNHVIFCAADNTKAHKFISFRPLDRERFVRGSAKSLGAEYTKERIKERIGEKALAKDKKRVPFPTKKKPILPCPSCYFHAHSLLPDENRIYTYN